MNSLQLYVEQTFTFMEYAGVRDICQYWTADELIELDAYCYDRFIDFIPSIATFGHLYELLCDPRYSELCELQDYKPASHFWRERMNHHTIDPVNPKSFRLISDIIDQYILLFRSKYFNICCDETFDLGKGRNLGRDKSELYLDFVSKLAAHVEKHGKTPMMWGEVLRTYPERLSDFPSNYVMLNWDYSAQPNHKRIEQSGKYKVQQILCPGTSSWYRFLEDINISAPNICNMVDYGYEVEAVGILNTNWGDYGHPAAVNCSLYGMLLGACKSWHVQTTVDSRYDAVASLLLYGDASGDMVETIRRLGKAQQAAPWLQLYGWSENRDASVFTASHKDTKEAIAICEEAMIVLLNSSAEKSIKRDLILAAEGILLCNQAVRLIKENGIPDIWHLTADKWFERYSAAWRSDNKESELSEIRKFMSKWV